MQTLTSAKQQSTRDDYIQRHQLTSVKRHLSPITSPRMNKATGEPTLVRVPKLTDPSVARIPKCARCRNHGIDCELKGHKEKCKFKNCSCRSCLVVVERQKVTATRVAHLRHQRKLAVKRGSETPDFRNRNPLTEEEELILSRHLQNKNADDKEYRTYSQPKIVERQEHYSDVIPPFVNTKACMLLREAQNAYSYFYGKTYYPPDDKDERNESQMLSHSKQHHNDKYYRGRDSHLVYSKTFKTVCTRDSEERNMDSGGKYNKCPGRPIIAPRVVRLDENQYYNDYFKAERRDYYYEQKIDLHNTPPSLYKYERTNLNIVNGNRLTEPLKVNNTIDKEHGSDEVSTTKSSHNNNNNHIDKRLEVLVVMFPEIKETRLKDVLRQHNSDIQSTVQFLLKIKNSPLDGGMQQQQQQQSCRTLNYAYTNNAGKTTESYSQISRSELPAYNGHDEGKLTKGGGLDAQELSAFTAVRRKCAR